jgi:hypothetical protein
VLKVINEPAIHKEADDLIKRSQALKSFNFTPAKMREAQAWATDTLKFLAKIKEGGFNNGS